MSEADAYWREKSDSELLDAASQLDQYTHEGSRSILAEATRRSLNVQPIAKAAAALSAEGPSSFPCCGFCGSSVVLARFRAGALRFCSPECRQSGVKLRASYQLPDRTVQERLWGVFSGACPECGGPGPVDYHTTRRIVSMFFLAQEVRRDLIVCARCARAALWKDTASSLLLGWWSLHGLVLTPICCGRNLLALGRERVPTHPSNRLEITVRLQLMDELVQPGTSAVLPPNRFHEYV